MELLRGRCGIKGRPKRLQDGHKMSQKNPGTTLTDPDTAPRSSQETFRASKDYPDRPEDGPKTVPTDTPNSWKLKSLGSLSAGNKGFCREFKGHMSVFMPLNNAFKGNIR